MSRAIILAGGEGRRLRPYTAVIPKPLMPLVDRPILEIVVGQLRRSGFDHITMAVGYLASLIQAYFGDGSKFGVEIDYSMEHEPLGTAGPLSVIAPTIDSDFLVMNGDVLTDLDYADFFATHLQSNSIASLAVYNKRLDVALGVLEMDDDQRVTGYNEKPQLHFPVSTGIYCFRRDIVDHLEYGAPCDLPVLVHKLIEADQTVRAHWIEGYWLDIGRPEDYEVAQEQYASGRFGELPKTAPGP